ncbi:MoxR-like ATPase [Chondrocystis sp. NIES-4102]|nr:MoxR-like ATPase [Chondrocystis sp. NIES-4102]
MQNNSLLDSLSLKIDEIVIGQSHLVKQLLVALLSGGHVIIEGVPGTGKTLMVKVLSRLIAADFRRIQLTPDILPSDILGTNIFDLNSREFILKKGPIFTEILLADEVNRTPPKTQAALLEAMEEQQITLDGETMPLSPLFWVIATQNSLEFEGTYPLPEAQLDRFLFKLLVDYPNKEAEKQILYNAQAGFKAKKLDLDLISAIASVDDILKLREQVQTIQVEDNIFDYLLNLVERTRQHPDLILGASPRSAVAWLNATKANAYVSGRNYVIPDDLKEVAAPLLRHRLLLKPEAQLDNVKVDEVIESILKQVSVPR